MKSSKAIRLVIALVAGTSVLGAADQAQDSFPKPNWQVKYQSGSLKLKRGAWLKIAFVADDRAQTGSSQVTVSQEQITMVRFSPKVEKDSELFEGRQRSGCAYARSMMPKPAARPPQHALLFAPSAPGVVSRFAEKLNRRHSVRLVWNDRGTEQLVAFAVNDCEYASFVANLHELLGARWQSVIGELD